MQGSPSPETRAYLEIQLASPIEIDFDFMVSLCLKVSGATNLGCPNLTLTRTSSEKFFEIHF